MTDNFIPRGEAIPDLGKKQYLYDKAENLLYEFIYMTEDHYVYALVDNVTLTRKNAIGMVRLYYFNGSAMIFIQDRRYSELYDSDGYCLMDIRRPFKGCVIS